MRPEELGAIFLQSLQPLGQARIAAGAQEGALRRELLGGLLPLQVQEQQRQALRQQTGEAFAGLADILPHLAPYREQLRGLGQAGVSPGAFPNEFWMPSPPVPPKPFPVSPPSPANFTPESLTKWQQTGDYRDLVALQPSDAETLANERRRLELERERAYDPDLLIEVSLTAGTARYRLEDAERERNTVASRSRASGLEAMNWEMPTVRADLKAFNDAIAKAYDSLKTPSSAPPGAPKPKRKTITGFGSAR